MKNKKKIGLVLGVLVAIPSLVLAFYLLFYSVSIVGNVTQTDGDKISIQEDFSSSLSLNLDEGLTNTTGLILVSSVVEDVEMEASFNLTFDYTYGDCLDEDITITLMNGGNEFIEGNITAFNLTNGENFFNLTISAFNSRACPIENITYEIEFNEVVA